MIHLKSVSEGNWYACTQLNVTEEQKTGFPAPVEYWIAESKGPGSKIGQKEVACL